MATEHITSIDQKVRNKQLNQFISMVNESCQNYKFGELQTIRKKRKPLKHSSKTPFHKTKKVWVHHRGGHKELQFNMGYDEGLFRWGIAISLQTNPSLHNVEDLFPKLERLSSLLETHGNHFNRLGFVMWDYTVRQNKSRQRSRDRIPQKIDRDLYARGTFIFFGKRLKYEEFDVDCVLRDFDLLLPVYESVEFGDESTSPTLYHPEPSFVFSPDPKGPIREYSNFTRATKSSTRIVNSRHGTIQNKLKQKLEHDGFQVGIEHPDSRGGFIDVVACREGDLYFYEIKTNQEPRLCVREAIGQLLEYAYRPNPIYPKYLTVVTEKPLDAQTDEYLRILRKNLNLNISHLQIEVDN